MKIDRVKIIINKISIFKLKELFLVAAFLTPAISYASSHTPSLQWLLYWFQYRLWTSWIAFFLFVLPSFLFLWGMAIFILNAGNEEKRSEGKQKMIWGLVALFVIFSIWGIIFILQKLFFGSVIPVSIPQSIP